MGKRLRCLPSRRKLPDTKLGAALPEEVQDAGSCQGLSEIGLEHSR